MVFISLSTVSAMEVNSIDYNMDSPYDQLELENYDEYISISDDENILSSTETFSGTTFSELQSKIDSLEDEFSVLELTNNITQDGNNIISISKSITINGNGVTIDAQGKSGIFSSSADYLYLNNITFKNAYQRDRDGGAVYCQNFIVAEYCNFVNNELYRGHGGAVWMYSGGVYYCNFINNTVRTAAGVETSGGAVCFYGYGIMNGCNFINNTDPKRGGAVHYMNSGGAVFNSIFINNRANDGGACSFGDNGILVSNCSFIDNNAGSGGGAIEFEILGGGKVSNCNFTNNAAPSGGAIYFRFNVDVTNCSFIKNTAISHDGGAIHMYAGTVTKCNFTDNTAGSEGGAIYTIYFSDLTNCNFTNNSAVNGGAVYLGNGNVTICNFIDNSATQGDAIYSRHLFSTADTCIFKRNSSENVNTVNLPPTLNVDNFTTFYGSGEKLSFDLRTNISSIRVTNGNISISVYSKNNGSWVGNYSCLSGEKWVPDLPVGSYYAIFDTEYAEFQPINRTIKIIPDIKFYANVTSVTTNNKTVNITAKSNIPNEIIEGKLLFILPNDANINANYAGNGTWWAVHAFDDCGEYKVNASYSGLDNVAVNNGTIAINKANSTITLDNITLDYGNSTNLTVTTVGASGITAEIEGVNVTVFNNYSIPISGLAAGNYTLTVTTVPDGDHIAVTETAIITVNKVNSTLTLDNIVLDYGDSENVTVTTVGASGITAEIDGNDVAVFNNYTIPISGWGAGNYTLNVTAVPDENHTAVSESVTITVNKVNSTLAVDNIVFDYGSEGSGVVSFAGASAVIANVVNQPSAVVSVSGKKITVSGLGAGNYTLNVTTVPDENHTVVTKTARITVNKLVTEIIITNETLDLKVSDIGTISADLTPDGAGNLTFTSSNESVIVVSDVGSFITFAKGIANVTVSFAGNDNYTAAESKTIEVTVSLNDASVVADDITLDVDSNDTISVVTTPVGLNVTYTPDNSGVVAVDENGVVTGLKGGSANVTITIVGNGKYYENSTTITVTVNKIPTEIILTNETLDLKVGNISDSMANLAPADAGNLNFSSSNESVVKVTAGGLIIALGKGNANVTVSFAGNDKYAAAESKTISVAVSLNDASVSVENSTLDLKVDDTFDLNAIPVPDLLDIEYSSDNESVAMVDDDGIIIAVGEGTAVITLSVGDDIMYAINSTTVTVTVSKIDTTITADDSVDMETGDKVIVNATLTPADAGELDYVSSDVSVVTVNGIGEVTAVAEGNATITVRFLGNDKYNPSNTTIDVSVLGGKDIILAPDVTKYFMGPERFAVNVTDFAGNPLANKSVTITINDVPYNRKTNENGTCSIAILLHSGIYNVTTTVDNETVNSVVTVLATINGTDLVKVFRNDTQYYATFRDSEGNYLKDGTEVTFNINGVFYNCKVSGDEGLVKLNINLEAGKYVLTAFNNVTGDRLSNNITVISRIVENNDITKYYRNATQYTVKLIGDDGNPVGAGEIVTFNINGVFYNRTTNESGIAKLNINLQPGDYVITAEYKNCRVSNNIKVLPVLSASDLTKKYGTADQFVAKLLDGEGKAFAEQRVQFNVNGVLYNSVTDSQGKAKLNINLQPGEYIITSSYNGSSISNKITIKS